MSKNNQSSWMFSPKSFIGLLGAEYGLMRDTGVLKRFYVSSLLIIATMILTWLSIDYAIKLLFHTVAIEITLALFFSLLFICIYIFLLNTFAKESRSSHGLFNASNVIRVGFIAFMGFLIAQPLIILLFSSSLAPAIDHYKQQVLEKHTIQITALAKEEIQHLRFSQAYFLDQKSRFGTSLYDDQLVKIDSAITSMQDKQASFIGAAQQAIERNSFFLYRVEKINREHPVAWLLSFLIVLLFLLPGYLIYSISSQSEYYQLKKAQDKQLIMTAYGAFTTCYLKMFSGQVTIFSRYADAPFNKIRKQTQVPASMTDFLQKYLDNG